MQKAGEMLFWRAAVAMAQTGISGGGTIITEPELFTENQTEFESKRESRSRILLLSVKKAQAAPQVRTDSQYEPDQRLYCHKA